MRTNIMHNEWNRIIAAAGLLGLAAIAPTQGMVTGLTEQNVGNGVQLTVEGTDLGKPKELRVLGGKAYIVEFEASLKGRAKSLDVDHGGVSSARVGWYRSNPPKVRLLVRLEPGETPILTETPGGYTVSVNVTEAKAAVASTVKMTKSPEGQQMDPNDEQPTPINAPKPKAKPAAVEQRVSLDFVNTDVVQILKALALQADVNIITSPEVQGRRITVSLERVTVPDALDFVTALAGLRYAQVQGSFVVSTRETFGEIMAGLADRSKQQNVIRIVPIISGDGTGIKLALNRWFGTIPLQVLMPGEKPDVAGATASPSGGTAAQGQAAGGGAAGTQPAMSAQTSPTATPAVSDAGKDESTPYLLLIGENKWVNQAESLVHRLDEEVMQARDLSKRAQRDIKDAADKEAAQYIAAQQRGRPETVSLTYSVQNGVAGDLKKVVDAASKDSGVSLVASPEKSTVQTLIVTGPEDSVNATMTTLKQLDTGAGDGDQLVAYDIKYVDPRALREMLVANVQGLIVSNAPGSAGNPRLYKQNQAFQQQNQTQATTQPQAGSTTNSASSGSSGSGVKGDNPTLQSVSLPFDDMETTAFPMRLFLRGSNEKIQQALKFLAKVDIAPRQIAIDMRVMELTKEDATQLGINWSILTGGAVKTISLNESQSGIGNNTAPANSFGIHSGLNSNTFANVVATLDAISNKNNLISRPNLMAMDGRESEIFVGDDVRYVESIVSSQTGPTIQSADLQVGVRLSVLPRIGGDGSITMDLRPLVSVLKGFNSTNTTGVVLNLPQTSLRISQSTVNVKSGETIAIGGLIQDQDQLNIQKLPILGDLPIVGQLFRQTTHNRTRSEIVFFLTVKEIEPNDRKDAADPRPQEQKNPGELPIPVRNILK